jgi:thiamine-phosphate pyrophosphorylase
MKQENFFQDAFAIIDANINRAKEGLRVCEDIARFHLKSVTNARAIGRVRHQLTLAVKKSSLDPRQLMRARDIESDPGKAFALGPARKTYQALFMANTQRVKEALRVLEEFSKIFDASLSRRLQRLRFTWYDTEKKVFQRFPTLFDP